MASHGGDDSGPWGGSPTTERVGSAYQEDDPVTIRDARPDKLGRTTDKSWSPGAAGPATRPADHGTPVAIFDGPTSGGDDDADITQRRFAVRERHGTMPMDQVLIPSEDPPPTAPAVTAHPATPQIMPPPLPSAGPQTPPPGEVLPNPLRPSRLQSPSVTTLASETDPPTEGPWTPPPAFSEQPPWEANAQAPKPRGSLVAFAIVGAVILAGGAFALGWAFKPAATDPSPASETPPTRAASAEPEEPAAEKSADGESDHEADDAPSASPSTETSAASSRPPIDEPSEAELAELLSYEGYLTVTSTADAEVYVQGKHVGPTNQRLVSKCYQRFVRLKKGTDGEWITPGRPVRIACMSSTTVEIDPE